MNTLQKLGLGAVAALVLFAAGYGTGRLMVPPKIVEKVVEKEVEKKNDNVVTTVTETKKPDGSTTKVTQTVDKSTEVMTDDKNTSIAITNAQPQYKVSAGIGYDFKNYRPQYMIEAEKKFIGPISIGVFGVTSGVVGLSLGVTF